MTSSPTPIKGFRTPPKPTKGQVQQENTSLAQELRQRLQSMQQFFGNLIQQLMRQSKAHDQELSQVAQWLSGVPTTEAAKRGDHLLMDYLGVTLKDDGTPNTVTLTDAEGKEVTMPDYFDGGNGKLFMLTNLGSGTLIPGFEEQLIGMKANEGKEVEAQFPEKYEVESLRGKKARFTVYIHAVARPYSNSPVGELIDQNARIREEARLKALADAQAAAAKAKAEAAPVPEAAPAEAPTEAPALDQPTTDQNDNHGDLPAPQA